MKIGLLIACDEEFNAHAKYFGKLKTYSVGNMAFYKGKFAGHTIFLCRSGPTEINAGIYVQAMIDKFKPDVIINSGTCGSFEEKCKVGDTFIVENATFWDVKLGILEQITYSCNEKLKDFALSLDKKFKPGKIVTGNSFVGTQGLKNRLIKKFGANCCDMEGVSVVYTCQKNNLPCLLIKCVSDSGNEEEFDKNFKKASEKAAKVAFLCIERLNNKVFK